MTLTLTLRDAPTVALEADSLRPDRVAGLARGAVERLVVWHGNAQAQVGDFFAVARTGSDPAGSQAPVRIEGDLRKVKFLGAGMAGGRLVIGGDAGMHAGAGMTGGELEIEGATGDFAGVGMHGGRLVVHGSAGRHLGGVLPGARAGMRGGEILVHGDAGAEAGAGLRRGLIAVAGRLGDAAGLRMLAGTIVALGGLGAHPGAGMRRGSIVAPTEAALLPTFAYACTYRPPFVALCLRRLRALGLPVSDAQVAGRYRRFSGDGLDQRRGEILILEAEA